MLMLGAFLTDGYGVRTLPVCPTPAWCSMEREAGGSVTATSLSMPCNGYVIPLGITFLLPGSGQGFGKPFLEKASFLSHCVSMMMLIHDVHNSKEEHGCSA